MHVSATVSAPTEIRKGTKEQKGETLLLLVAFVLKSVMAQRLFLRKIFDRGGINKALQTLCLQRVSNSHGEKCISSCVLFKGGAGGGDDRSRTRFRLGYSKVASFCLLLGVGIGVSKQWMETELIQTVAAAEWAGDGSDKSSNRMRLNFIADVVEKAAPSVVCIECYGVSPFGSVVKASNGSGFIVSSDGLILTNAHLFSHANSKIMVKLKDGRSFPGVVESLDVASDLATVRISATGLPALKLGASSSLRPGEFVIAIGSPLSLNNTVTSGIVSSFRAGSELGAAKREMEYIQTDASITFGNSGGPLLNLDGEAIGINSMTVTKGISFAIPSDHAKEFLKLAGEGKHRVSTTKRRAYMGITMLSVTPSVLATLNIQRGYCGVLVCRVDNDSPAAVAGLQKGDIITHINGKVVESTSTVHEVLENDDKLNCIIARGDKRYNVIVNPVKTEY